MARRGALGRQFSVFTTVEDLNAVHDCMCSVFLPGGQEEIPQYIASAYSNGRIRLHDSSALTMGESDGISASHFCSFVSETCPIVQLKAMQMDAGMLLLCLGGDGRIFGTPLDEVLTRRGDKDDIVQPRRGFKLLHEIGWDPTCFAVDDVNYRIFAGGYNGWWTCYDLERSASGPRLKETQDLSGHHSRILDVDYCQGLLASSSNDGAVCIWDVRSASCIAAFDPATGRHLPLSYVNRRPEPGRSHSLQVRFDKNGRHVVASSRHKHVTVWNIRSDSAQCTFQTDCIPHTLDTAKDFVFFSGSGDCVWRYSMYNAQMQCYHTNVASINHFVIDRNLQKTMVISGAADTVELLSLDGTSLGKVTGRKDTADEGVIFTPEVQRVPSFRSMFSGTPENPNMIPPSPTYICESGTDMMTEEEADEYLTDEASSVCEFSPANYPMSSSTGDDIPSDGDEEMSDELWEPGMGVMEMEEAPLEAYGFTSDSDISPPYEYAIPVVSENANCDFSSSQSDEILSDEEEE